MHYFATQCQAQESSDWMCATDHAYEICWQEETFAAAAYLSCQCHLISDLTGRLSLNLSEQVQNTGIARTSNTPFMHHDTPPSFTLFPLTPSPTSPPPDCTPITIPIPHHPNSIPHWPVTRCMHPYIHTCIIALTSMHGHKCGPNACKHKYMHNGHECTTVNFFWQMIEKLKGEK